MWRDVSDEEGHRPPDRDVEITAVETTGLRGNPRDDGGHFVWGLVKVETDAGVYGLGETFRGEAALDVVSRMAPDVVGQNPLDPDRIGELLDRRHTDAGGIGRSAIAAIETACWDAKGKVHDLPLYELFGGKYRDAVHVYSDTEALAGDEEGIDLAAEYTPESYAAAARAVVDRGFDSIKFDLDVPTPGRTEDAAARRLDPEAIEHKVALVAAVRDEVGDGIDLGMDLHWTFTTETAIRLGRALEPYDLAFLEDPVHPRKVDAQVRVREAVETPILSGENLTTKEDFEAQARRGVFDIAAPDVMLCGGLSELRRIAAICDVHAIPLAPHNLGSPVGTVAGVHVCASVPNVYRVEFRGGDAPWWHDVVTRTGEDGRILEGDRIDLPEGPGLGIELAPAAEELVADGHEWVF